MGSQTPRMSPLSPHCTLTTMGFNWVPCGQTVHPSRIQGDQWPSSVGSHVDVDVCPVGSRCQSPPCQQLWGPLDELGVPKGSEKTLWVN